MFIKFLVLMIVVAVLYKLLRSHGCGSSCQANPPGPSTICRCACATCPCSPLQAFDFIPNTFTHYFGQVKAVVKDSQVGTCSIEPTSAERSAQYSSITLTSPLVIEESHRVSRHSDSVRNSSTSGTPSTSAAKPRKDEPKAMCNKCKSRGMTCMKSCPRAKTKNGKSVGSNTE